MTLALCLHSCAFVEKAEFSADWDDIVPLTKQEKKAWYSYDFALSPFSVIGVQVCYLSSRSHVNACMNELGHTMIFWRPLNRNTLRMIAAWVAVWTGAPAGHSPRSCRVPRELPECRF